MFPESNIYIPNFDSQGTLLFVHRTRTRACPTSPSSQLVTLRPGIISNVPRKQYFFSKFLTLRARSTGVCERGSDDSPNKDLRHSRPAQSQRIHDSLFPLLCWNMRICVDACVGYEPVRRNFYLYSPRSLPLSLWISAQYTETPSFQYLVGDVYSAASRPITCGVRGSTLWQIKGSPNLLFILL
jgi:hypothetical protein